MCIGTKKKFSSRFKSSVVELDPDPVKIYGPGSSKKVRIRTDPDVLNNAQNFISSIF
jgi:hypothetical protein